MPDGVNRVPDGEAAFPFWGSQSPTSLQAMQQGLARAWCLTLASRIGEALKVLETMEGQFDNRSPPVATRYRAASRLVRSAVMAFQDDNLATLAIVVSKVFGAPVMEPYSRTERFEPIVGGPRYDSGEGALGGDTITARERDVLSMISKGSSNKHIARTLKISPETVKSHVKRIFLKLSVSTRTEAVSRAMSLRLLQ